MLVCNKPFYLNACFKKVPNSKKCHQCDIIFIFYIDVIGGTINGERTKYLIPNSDRRATNRA